MHVFLSYSPIVLPSPPSPPTDLPLPNLVPFYFLVFSFLSDPMILRSVSYRHTGEGLFADTGATFQWLNYKENVSFLAYQLLMVYIH